MQNIFLVGPMGSGKTTIGRQLAARLGKNFYDSDKEIEKRTGVNIALIFEIEGETGFRKRESKMLEELATEDNIVLATGGGVILDENNRQLLKSRGKVVYLKSSAEKLYQRTARDKKRPLLNTPDRLETIKQLLDFRQPLYEEVADLIMVSDGNSVRQIVTRIEEKLEE